MRPILILCILMSVLALRGIAEPLVTVDRERIMEICRDAITGKYEGIEQTSIKFKTLSYEELSGGDKILKVRFDVPLARKPDPHFHSKNSVTVVLLATGGIIRVDSSHERLEELKAAASKARQQQKETEQKN
mgnify:CR=1 FL=1